MMKEEYARTTENQLESYCRDELKRAGLFDEDSDYGGMLGEAVMELVEVFAKQGHSGFSAGRVLQLFHHVASFKPLTPLTGNDDEWNEVSEGLLQNKRFPAIFKDLHTGKSYNSEGKLYRYKGNSSYFLNKGSRVEIEFPYFVKEPEVIEIEKGDQ